MGMSHRSSVFFMFPFKISVLPLSICIPFLFNMATQSLSHNWHKEIIETLCNPLNMCFFFARAIRLLGRGVFCVLFALIVIFFGKLNCWPNPGVFTFVSTAMSSVR